MRDVRWSKLFVAVLAAMLTGGVMPLVPAGAAPEELTEAGGGGRIAFASDAHGAGDRALGHLLDERGRH